MLKKIACFGLAALSLLTVMTDDADALFRRRHRGGCNTCQPACNSCGVPQGQFDPNAPMIDPNGPAPMNAPAQPPVQPPAPQTIRGNAA